MPGPKHSIIVPFSAWVAVPVISVDEKEVALVPNPAPGEAVKESPGPQEEGAISLCIRGHSSFPPTLQVVSVVLSPAIVHLKVMVSPGQAGGAAVNCPAALSA